MMKSSFLLLGVTMSLSLIMGASLKGLNAQLLDVKPRRGTYPEMKGSYPLSFIAFKGWLFPVPHVFVRSFPSHYYVELGALPVTDSGELAGGTKNGLLRIAAKLLEREQMKGRQKETIEIREQTELRKAIHQMLFDARKDQLPDSYQLADQFVDLYDKVKQFDQIENSTAIRTLLEKEADELLIRFFMINLMKSDHGAKFASFSEIQSELTLLAGEVVYTYRKLFYLRCLSSSKVNDYAFLTH